jgi:hypothetical protein
LGRNEAHSPPVSSPFAVIGLDPRIFCLSARTMDYGGSCSPRMTTEGFVRMAHPHTGCHLSPQGGENERAAWQRGTAKFLSPLWGEVRSGGGPYMPSLPMLSPPQIRAYTSPHRPTITRGADGLHWSAGLGKQGRPASGRGGRTVPLHCGALWHAPLAKTVCPPVKTGSPCHKTRARFHPS